MTPKKSAKSKLRQPADSQLAKNARRRLKSATQAERADPNSKPNSKPSHKGSKPTKASKSVESALSAQLDSKLESKPGTRSSAKIEAQGAPVTPSEMSSEVIEFINAVDRYKRSQRRPFPSWSEVLEIFKSLGYQKSA